MLEINVLHFIMSLIQIQCLDLDRKFVLRLPNGYLHRQCIHIKTCSLTIWSLTQHNQYKNIMIGNYMFSYIGSRSIRWKYLVQHLIDLEFLCLLEKELDRRELNAKCGLENLTRYYFVFTNAVLEWW